MTCYRLYYLDPFSGHIDRLEEIEAADEAEAIALASALPREVAVELWHESHKLLRLERPANVSAPGKSSRAA